MFSPALAKMIHQEPGKFLIPANKIAFVQEDNPLYHAFLLLTKVKYAKIPVLAANNRLVGLISLAMITNQMLTADNILIAPLSSLKVKDVMQTNFAKLKLGKNSYETQLDLLIDHNFIPVVNQKEQFQGLITRREWLKTFNFLSHHLENNYQLIPKQLGKTSK